MAEISWGILLAAYIFVGGMAGGAFMIAALADLFGKDKYKELSKSGTYVSIVSIIVGLVLLVLDLGRFDVDPLGVLNAFIHFPTSIMSVGTWIISALTIATLLTAVLWMFNGITIVRKLLGIVGFVLGGSTTAYTGLLLSFSRGRPFWASPFLPWTFIISGSLTGLAMSLLLIPVIAFFMPRFSQDFKELVDDKQRFANVLVSSQRYVFIMIIVEMGLVLIEIVTGHFGALLNLGGLSILFIVYVVLGLLLPLGVAYFSQKAEYIGVGMQAPVSMISFVFILIGGFLLRYVILTAGQLIL
jgi:formate-dependent nitrite reductase membrane component NrfD